MMNIQTLKARSLNIFEHPKTSTKSKFNHNDQKQTREAFVELISSQPNKYCLTISYIKDTTDINANRALNLFIHFLNQKVLTRNYKNSILFIDGFVARERTKSGTLHYHLVFNENNAVLPEYDEFYELVFTCMNKIKVNHKSTRRITDDKGWDLQEYFNNGDSDFEKYITKNFECSAFNAIEAFNSIGVISYDKVEFGADPRRHDYH